MTMTLPVLIAFLVTLFGMPPLVIGVIRKTKARLQNRIGAPILQPYFDLMRLFCKRETVSDITSWLFRPSAAFEVAVMLLLAGMVPWISYVLPFCPADLFAIVYLFAIVRVSTILFALDSASPFGSFGSSREVTLAMLVEPATVLALVSLAVCAGTSNLSRVFSYTSASSVPSALWCLVALALLLSSVVELSRMPIDDPTTHLELTMVHEAMMIEASGRVLALKDFAYALRLTVLVGLSVQCILHALPFMSAVPEFVRGLISVAGIFALAVALAIFESVSVKLGWRKAPEFIAYAITISLFSCLVAVGRGAGL